MNQAALIQALCDDLTPVRPSPPIFGLMRASLIGAGGVLLVLLEWLGVHTGLEQGQAFAAFVLKAGTMTAIAMLAMRSLAALAQPGSPPMALMPGLVRIIALLVFVALGQMLVAHESGSARVLFGTSWQSCPWRIAVLSLPLLAGLLWVLRQQAPVHLRRTGAIAGLCAGSMAAALYALACTEQSAAFMLAWYGMGIGATTLVGMAVGPAVLRW